LIAAAIAIVCGTIPIGFGLPVLATLSLGSVALIAVLLLVEIASNEVFD